MTIDNSGFGEKVRTLRSQKNLTPQELAKMTKRSVSLLSQIETGEVSPSFSSMRIIADDKVVTHRFPLEKHEEAFDTFRHRKDGAIKVVVEP